MNKVKDMVVTLLSLVTLVSLIVSCSPTSVIEHPVSNEQPPIVIEVAQSSTTEQSANPLSTHGLRVVVKSLCSDGVNTTLILKTDLDPEFWQRRENDFYPKGKTYYETSILFLENNEMYSAVSSGKRDETVFDSEKNGVSTLQTFVFPTAPLPNSEFTLKAKVWLGNLPAGYTLPAQVNFLEPGILKFQWSMLLLQLLHASSPQKYPYNSDKFVIFS
jgi:hypothetical protein